jgi:hypothetical protein
MAYNISMNKSLKKALKIFFVICFSIFIILALLGYFYYLDFKRSFIQTLSGKSSAFIGQPVEIGDLSFSPSSGINLYNVSVRNPEGFPSGNLLRIKRIYLNTKYSELFSGRFYSRNITVYAPELTIIKDGNGRSNISDKLIEFFRKKSSLTYQVDEFNIESGRIGFNNDKRFGNENISMHIKNLSSAPGVKTLIEGSTLYADGKIAVAGWAYPKDEPKKFSLSASSGEISLSAFRELLEPYKVYAEKAGLKADLSIEGDTDRGAKLKANLYIKDIGLPFVKGIRTVTLKTDAGLDLQDNSFHIDSCSLNAEGLLSIDAKALLKNIIKKPAYNAEVKINGLYLSALELPRKIKAEGLLTSNKITVEGDGEKKYPKILGSLILQKLSLINESNKNIISNASINSEMKFNGGDINFRTDMHAGKITLAMAGTAKNIIEKHRSINVSLKLPEAKLADIRDAFWDVFPDKLLYAGLDGSVLSRLLIDYRANNIKVGGEIAVQNIVIRGENGEYTIGPINGVLPLAYAQSIGMGPSPSLYRESIDKKFPYFERAQFNDLRQYFSRKTDESGYSTITIDSLDYGFRLFDNIRLKVKQEGAVLNVAEFNGNISGGKMNGSAYVDLSKGIQYRAGFILEGLSLTKFCEGIEPIKGYISGKMDGVANLKGSGSGIANLIGKADLWTYSTGDEKTKISKQFLQKIGGPALKTYLGDRRFDKGNISLYLKEGFIIFDELEISNKNLLGMTDLSVKVAPFNNRISIDHLMWTITEAATRAQKKEESK